MLNIKEMFNRVLDVPKDKHTTWFYVELPKIDMEALRKKDHCNLEEQARRYRDDSR